MAKWYSERDLAAIINGEWELVRGAGAEVESGIGVTATSPHLRGTVWKHPHDIALPFPFTLDQFRAFCAWHPSFEWDAVESEFTNDDGLPDEDALTELSERGANAAELVRRFLMGDSDGEPSASKAVQLKRRGDNTNAPATTVTGNATPAGLLVATPRNLLTPAIEKAQKGLPIPFDPPAVFLALRRMAETQEPPLLGVTDDGIKWKDANDDVRFLTIKNLRDRLHRMKRTR